MTSLISLIGFLCLGTLLISEEFNLRTIDEWRAATKNFGQYVGKPACVSYSDRTILTRDDYPLSCRIFNDRLSSDSPVLIFYPGCAFLFDIFEVNSVICSRIASAAGIKVILVQFRLAPEFPMPISLNDCYDAACQIALHPEEFKVDAEKIFIGGWCSGAHASTVVSNQARRDKKFLIYHQILISGSFDLSHSIHDFDDWEAQDPTFNRTLLTYWAQRYYSMDHIENPLFSPYFETDFTDCPSTTLICGEYDGLRNDTEGYFQKLKASHIPVEKIVLLGQTHNTIAMRDLYSDGPDPAEIIAQAIRKKLKILK